MTDEPLIEAAMGEGANSYFEKGPGINELIEGIKHVYESNYYFSKEFSESLIQKVLEHRLINPSYNFTAKVSPKEKEVVLLISKGLTNSEIAKQMGISENTVNDHKKKFTIKTKAKGKLEISVYCFWRGWV